MFENYSNIVAKWKTSNK